MSSCNLIFSSESLSESCSTLETFRTLDRTIYNAVEKKARKLNAEQICRKNRVKFLLMRAQSILFSHGSDSAIWEFYLLMASIFLFYFLTVKRSFV